MGDWLSRIQPIIWSWRDFHFGFVQPKDMLVIYAEGVEPYSTQGGLAE
jgi:hypothetical protein